MYSKLFIQCFRRNMFVLSAFQARKIFAEKTRCESKGVTDFFIFDCSINTADSNHIHLYFFLMLSNNIKSSYDVSNERQCYDCSSALFWSDSRSDITKFIQKRNYIKPEESRLKNPRLITVLRAVIKVELIMHFFFSLMRESSTLMLPVFSFSTCINM